MDKKTLEDIKKNIKEFNRKMNDPNFITASKISDDLIRYTTPLEWSVGSEDDQPVILIPLKIPKTITDFLDYLEKHSKDTSKEKLMQAIGDVIILRGLSACVHGNINKLDENEVNSFIEILKKEMGE